MFGFKLTPEERLLHTYRQTKWVLLKPLTIAAVVVLLPWYFFISRDIDGFNKYLITWSVLVFVYVIRSLILWRASTYIITNKRLIRIGHEGIFRRVVAETPLDRILNVSFKTTGLASVLLGFGDVVVQVVGLIEPLILKHIRRPAYIKDYLWQVHTRFLEQREGKTDIPHLQEKIGYTKEGQRVV